MIWEDPFSINDSNGFFFRDEFWNSTWGLIAPKQINHHFRNKNRTTGCVISEVQEIRHNTSLRKTHSHKRCVNNMDDNCFITDVNPNTVWDRRHDLARSVWVHSMPSLYFVLYKCLFFLTIWFVIAQSTVNFRQSNISIYVQFINADIKDTKGLSELFMSLVIHKNDMQCFLGINVYSGKKKSRSNACFNKFRFKNEG